MTDPLDGFDWEHLDERYDARCKRYDPTATHLKARSDRELYFAIVQAIGGSSSEGPKLCIDLYKALLYWKLYSQGCVEENLSKWFAPEAESTVKQNLACLVDNLPRRVSRDPEEIVSLVTRLGIYKLPGIKSKTALPVRSTLLHFIFPDVIPIFDKMVLRAVGVSDKDANQNIGVFREYLSFVWMLADRHVPKRDNARRETPIRRIEMALWVRRDSKPKDA